MSRWNISHVIFYSKNNLQRIIDFKVNGVTIITGASNTGKSALINSIDYCLGSSKCKVASFIVERTTHIATKWTNGNTEFVVSREISKSGRATDNMYIEYGSNVDIAKTPNELKGKGSKMQIRSIIEMLFGIKDVNDKELNTESNRITLRQLTAFMYLDKSVIDSEKILMHGLDDTNSAKYIIESLPYFLGAITQEELEAIRKSKQLKRGIQAEERKQSQIESQKSKFKTKCNSLINEALQANIIEKVDDSTNEELLILLKDMTSWEPQKLLIEDKSVLSNLEKDKKCLLANLSRKKLQIKNAKTTGDTTSEFSAIISQQKSKLNLEKYFDEQEHNCPICNTELKSSSIVTKLIAESFNELKLESKAIHKYRPQIDKYIESLDDEVEEIKNKLNLLNMDITNLIKESEINGRRYLYNQMASRVIGRVSYFLDNYSENKFDSERLERYTRELTEITNKYGKSAREEKIQLAERIISSFATTFFDELPRGEPCLNSTINFFSNPPKIVLHQNEKNKNYPFENIGSDENYLSIHLAFSFALQKFFKEEKSPVPGLLILDQVSRPYYSSEDDDEIEISDSDSTALKKHFRYIFKQVKEQDGLQVVILEHAYFKDDEEYKAAVKYRWTKKNKDKLIPPDWPIDSIK